MSDKLNEHFSLPEFVASDTATRLGIDNTPSSLALANIVNVLAPGMWRVREALGHPVLISSGYRSEALNRAIRGAPTSAHRYGLAADFRSPSFGRPSEIAAFLADRIDDIGFEQLIHEGAWVHIAFPEVGRVARGEVLTAHFSGGDVSYTRGLA